MALPWQIMDRPIGRWLVYQSTDWEQYAGPEWLERIMTVDVRDRLHEKQGRSIARWTLERDGRSLVVFLKRHFELAHSDAWKSRLFPNAPHSPGLQEWVHLQQAEKLGLRVPRVTAAGELRRTDGKLQGFIALEELTGMLALHEAIPLAERTLSTGEFQTWKQGLFTELARLSWVLHRAGFYHQDLYLCHFYILEEHCKSSMQSWMNDVVMIDFHRLIQTRVGLYKRFKDLSQFLFSTYDVSGVTDSDRQHYWQQYQALARDSKIIRHSLWKAMQHKARRYHTHNRKGTT